MPRGVITDRYAGVLLCGDVIASGYIPPQERDDKSGEKYYLQVTAPGLSSYAVRMSEAAWNQFFESGADMGTPCALEVRSSVFNGQQYYSADSFFLREPGRPDFLIKGVLKTSSASVPVSSSAKPKEAAK